MNLILQNQIFLIKIFNSISNRCDFYNNSTILYFACMSGNLELVKYLDSFKKIDVTIVTIFT